MLKNKNNFEIIIRFFIVRSRIFQSTLVQRRWQVSEYGAWWNLLTGKHQNNRVETCHRAPLPTTKLKWTDLGSNPGQGLTARAMYGLKTKHHSKTKVTIQSVPRIEDYISVIQPVI